MEILIAAIILVGLCVIGMCFNIIFRKNGHFPETEISSNREMRKRHGKENPTCSDLGCGDCSGCEISTDTDKQQKI